MTRRGNKNPIRTTVSMNIGSSDFLLALSNNYVSILEKFLEYDLVIYP